MTLEKRGLRRKGTPTTGPRRTDSLAGHPCRPPASWPASAGGSRPPASDAPPPSAAGFDLRQPLQSPGSASVSSFAAA
eukprot:scaffold3076_cov248-Pinguiococcus_pyrenoidosus.AAC.1